ncbi:MAG: alpha/beta fold hydrolase [Actinomycetota bacterium]
MAHFSYDGFSIAYEQRGRKEGARARPILLMHGLLFSRTHHYYLADVLAERGNRVILMDFLGHGQSDKPDHSRHYTMELFARQAVALLDHLDLPEAVVAGTSLGANVALEVVNHAPGRTRAIFVEMPVLERATIAAATIFVPLTVAYAEAAPVVRWFARGVRRLPANLGVYPDAFRELLSRDPRPSAAILHGLLTGRIAPHPSDREKMDVPALVIGHRRDLLHPLSDAEALTRELPNSRLVEARTFFELRFPPNQLSDAVAEFLDEVWST